MLVGALFFLPRLKLAPLLLLVSVLAWQPTLTYLTGDRYPNVGTGLFSLWLAGFAGYFLLWRGWLARVPTWALALFALVSFVLYGLLLVPGSEYDLRAYAALAGVFLALIAAAMRFVRTDWGRWGAVVRFGADYSFTLYLLHHTVLYALSRFQLADSVPAVIVGVVAANVLSALVAWPTEMRYRQLAAWLKQTLLVGRARLRDA